MGDARWDAPPRRRGAAAAVKARVKACLLCRGAGSKISERHVKVQAMLRFEVCPSAVLDGTQPATAARPPLFFLIALKVASPI